MSFIIFFILINIVFVLFTKYRFDFIDIKINFAWFKDKGSCFLMVKHGNRCNWLIVSHFHIRKLHMPTFPFTFCSIFIPGQMRLHISGPFGLLSMLTCMSFFYAVMLNANFGAISMLSTIKERLTMPVSSSFLLCQNQE